MAGIKGPEKLDRYDGKILALCNLSTPLAKFVSIGKQTSNTSSKFFCKEIQNIYIGNNF